MQKQTVIKISTIVLSLASLLAVPSTSFAESLTGSSFRIDNTQFNTGLDATSSSTPTLSGSNFTVTNDGQSLSGAEKLTGSSFTVNPGAGTGTTTTSTPVVTTSGGGVGGIVPKEFLVNPYSVPNVIKLQTSQPTQVAATPVLSWTNPTISAPNPPIASIIVVRSESGYPTSPTAGTKITEGLINSYTDTSVKPNTAYFYTVFVKDASGRYSSGSLIAAYTKEFQKEEPTPEPTPETPKKTTPTKKPTTQPTPNPVPTPEPIEPKPAPEPVVPVEPLPQPEPTREAPTTKLDPIKQNLVILSEIKVETATPDSIGSLSNWSGNLISKYDYFRWLADTFGLTTYKGFGKPDSYITVNLSSKTAGVDWELVSVYDAKITVPAKYIPADLDNLILTIGSNSYFFALDESGQNYVANFTVDASSDIRQALIQGSFKDGSRATLNYNYKTVKGGYVSGFNSKTGASIALSPAVVWLKNPSGTLYLPAVGGYANPQVSSSKPENIGEYIFIANPGSYTLVSKAKGYRTYTSQEIKHDSTFLNQDFTLQPYPWWYFWLTLLVILLIILVIIYAIWRRYRNSQRQ